MLPFTDGALVVTPTVVHRASVAPGKRFDGVVTELAVPRAAASVPPQNLEAEESVLGAMMLSPSTARHRVKISSTR